MIDTEYGTTVKARTARKPHNCEDRRLCNGTGAIQAGDRYLRWVAFPGSDVNGGDKPYEMKVCTPCTLTVDPGRAVDLGICARYCHGVEPCALPFKHPGDCRCHRCPKEVRRG